MPLDLLPSRRHEQGADLSALRHSDREAQYLAIRYTERLADAVASVGSKPIHLGWVQTMLEAPWVAQPPCPLVAVGLLLSTGAWNGLIALLRGRPQLHPRPCDEHNRDGLIRRRR